MGPRDVFLWWSELDKALEERIPLTAPRSQITVSKLIEIMMIPDWSLNYKGTGATALLPGLYLEAICCGGVRRSPQSFCHTPLETRPLDYNT